jgi:hypothetical protein
MTEYRYWYPYLVIPVIYPVTCFYGYGFADPILSGSYS